MLHQCHSHSRPTHAPHPCPISQPHAITCAEVLWAQEEPMNMGAYLHVQPRLQRCEEVRWVGMDEWAAGCGGQLCLQRC